MAVDEEDVKSLLAKNKEAIDLKDIDKLLSEFGKIAEHECIKARFDTLLKK